MARRQPAAVRLLRARRPEIAFALAGAAVSLLVLSPPAGAFAAALAVLAAVVAASDIERFIIPDSASAAIFGLGLALTAIESPPQAAALTLGDTLLRAAAAAGALYALRVAYFAATGIEGLGLGDVKLAAAAAPWLDWPSLPLALALAAIAALFAVGARALARRKRPDRLAPLPFGAFLALAVWVTFLFDRSELALLLLP